MPGEEAHALSWADHAHPGETSWRIAIGIEGIPPGGNALHRMTHWQVRDERAKWKARTERSVEALLLPTPPAIPRCALTVRWAFRVRRSRDFDNLIAGLKPVIDGLVSSGVLQGDSTREIIEIRCTTVEGAEQDGLVIVVESV
jgi:hypothetical protein